MLNIKKCIWCTGEVGKNKIELKKYGIFCSNKCAREFIEMHFCDYKDCTNEPYAEVYKVGKRDGWNYLCRKHFEQERNRIRKNGGFWCEVG
jgi:hypothetical protein